MRTAHVDFEATSIDPGVTLVDRRDLKTDGTVRSVLEFTTAAAAFEFYDYALSNGIDAAGYPDGNTVTVRTRP